jgi:TRAP-type C4-dicarboxylate transport system permease small subunit
VIARYVFNAPPFWTEELARFCLIWLTFVGAVVVHAERSHTPAP